MSVDVDLSVGAPMRRDQLADGGKGNAYANTAPPTTTGAQGARGPNQPLTSIKGFDIGASSRNPSSQFASSSSSSVNFPSQSQPGTSFGSLPSTAGTSSSGGGGGRVESDGGWALSWCPEHWWGEVLVVAAGPSSLIRLIRFGSGGAGAGEWTVLQSMGEAEGGTGGAPVASLCWGPPCGRDFHLVAAGYRDGRAKVWRLEAPPLTPNSHNASSDGWTAVLDADLTSHVRTSSSSAPNSNPASSADQPKQSGGVGRCEFNATGTVLSTSGSEGKVRIWKRGFNGSWVQVGEVGCEDGEEEEAEGEGEGMEA